MVDAYRAVAPTLAAAPGSDVLVMGGTPSLGLLVVLFAVALGTGVVVYCDPDPAGAELARQLGATQVIVGARPAELDASFDLTVDASADPAGARSAVLAAAPGGTCVIRSVFFDELAIPYWDLYRTGITLRIGPPHVRPYAPDVLELLAGGRVDPTPVLGAPYPFDAAPDVLLEAPRKPVFVRPPTSADA
jgi:alcohol dehydrogenase